MLCTATDLPKAPGEGGGRLKFQRIQILRFIAATAVVAFHALGTGQTYLSPETHFEALSFGYLGVDLFFVISGFIICHTAPAVRGAWRPFVLRRIERVVPPYWFCTIAMFGLMLIPGLSRGGGMGFDTLWQSLLFVTWTGGPDNLPVVFVGWSLEYEMLFYLAVALAVAFTARPWLAIGIGLPGLVLAGRFADPGQANALWQFLGNPLLLEFVIGAAIARMLVDRRAGAAMMLVSLACLLTLGTSDEAWRIWIGGIPAAAMVALAVWRDLKQPLRSAAAARLAYLGDASYSIYLAQVFILSGIYKAIVALWPGMPLDLAIVAITLTGVIAGCVLFELFEKPVLRWFRRRHAPRAEAAGQRIAV